MLFICAHFRLCFSPLTFHNFTKYQKLFCYLRRPCLSHCLSEYSAKMQIEKDIVHFFNGGISVGCVISIWKCDRILRTKLLHFSFLLSFALLQSFAPFLTLRSADFHFYPDDVFKGNRKFSGWMHSLIVMALCHETYYAPNQISAKS